MKITKDYLKRIIKEEMNKVLKEQNDSELERLKNHYREYFDFSGVTKTEGNKLDFSEATDLDEIYETIYIDDPGELYSGRDNSNHNKWANRVAIGALERQFKNQKEAASTVMKELLEEYKDSIKNYIELVREVAGRNDVVSFDFDQANNVQDNQRARYILAEMIKLLSIGKRFEDYDY